MLSFVRSLSPLYGKLSDLIGRKPILYASIVIFLVRAIPLQIFSRWLLDFPQIGSALCGAAQNIVGVLFQIRFLMAYENADMASRITSRAGYRRRWNHPACSSF